MAQSLPSAAYERALFVIKVQLGLIGFAVLIIAALSSVIIAMFPLKTTELVVYEFKTGTQNFVKVQAAGQNMRANEPLLDRFIREYVTYREKVDRLTEQDRYRRVYAMNSADENKRFRAAYGGEDAPVNQPGFNRDVKIIRSTRLANSYYQVEFQTSDSWEDTPDVPPVENEWVATMAFTFSDQMVSKEEANFNPLGLFVSRYSLSRRQ